MKQHNYKVKALVSALKVCQYGKNLLVRITVSLKKC